MTIPRCQEARDRLAQLISGDIEPEVRREVETHLRACPDCSNEAAGIRRALSLLETDAVPDPGLPYWSSFGRRLRARIVASARRRRSLRLAALAAAAVLVAVLALVHLRREAPPRQIAEEPVGGPHTVTGAGHSAAPMAADVPGSRPTPPRAAAPALSVPEAEARLGALLRQAAAEGQDPRDLEAILDEVAPPHPLDGADVSGRLSPEDDRSLSEDPLDTQG